MKYLKRFNENENIEEVNESLKTTLLIPFLMSVGFINSQKLDNDNINDVLQKQATEIVLDKSELYDNDTKLIIADKAKKIYDIINSNPSIREDDFNKYCLDNNIDKSIFNKFLDKSSGSFITNIQNFGNVYQANINVSKELSIYANHDPFKNNHLGIKYRF